MLRHQVRRDSLPDFQGGQGYASRAPGRLSLITVVGSKSALGPSVSESRLCYLLLRGGLSDANSFYCVGARRRRAPGSAARGSGQQSAGRDLCVWVKIVDVTSRAGAIQDVTTSTPIGVQVIGTPTVAIAPSISSRRASFVRPGTHGPSRFPAEDAARVLSAAGAVAVEARTTDQDHAGAEAAAVATASHDLKIPRLRARHKMRPSAMVNR